MYHAVEKGNFEIVKTLLMHKPDLEIETHEGKSQFKLNVLFYLISRTIFDLKTIFLGFKRRHTTFIGGKKEAHKNCKRIT